MTSDPHVDHGNWNEYLLNKEEVTQTLLFLAHRTGKPVYVRPYETPRVTKDRIDILVPTSFQPYPGSSQKNVPHVRLEGKDLELDPKQVFFRLESEPSGFSLISDEIGNALAMVASNIIVARIDFTAADNEAGRAILLRIAQQASNMLSFEVDESERSVRRNELIANLSNVTGENNTNVRTRLRRDIERHDADISGWTSSIQSAHQARTQLMLELKASMMNQGDENKFLGTMVDELLNLEAAGNGFEKIGWSATKNHTLEAITDPVVIDYRNYKFELGRYRVELELRAGRDGRILIFNIDNNWDCGYQHPHVISDGSPCWGNIHNAVYKALNDKKFATLLGIIREYLSSYCSGGEYSHISNFDLKRKYIDDGDDEGEDACEDCNDRATPYCVMGCEYNEDGERFTCHDDCREFRTEYCYVRCQYNLDSSWEYVNPCDDCDDEGKFCFTECKVNIASKMNIKVPCEYSEYVPCSDYENCEGCPFIEYNPKPPRRRSGQGNSNTESEESSTTTSRRRTRSTRSR